MVFVWDINNPPQFWSPTCVTSEIQCSWCSTNLGRRHCKQKHGYVFAASTDLIT